MPEERYDMQIILTRIWLAVLLLGAPSFSGLAKSGIITTYVGPQLPISGGEATAQDIGYVKSVASDGNAILR